MNDGNGGRERLAWGVLLAGFVIWLAIIVAVPIAIGNFLQDARRPLVVSVQANQGTVGLENEAGGRQAIFAGDDPRPVEGVASVLTNATDTAVLLIYTPDESQILSRVQVYGNTTVEILEASAPRFAISSAGPAVWLGLETGRLGLTIPPDGQRLVNVVAETPQSVVTLNAVGQYSVEADNAETRVAVQEGQAMVAANGETVRLQGAERATVPLDAPPAGPLSSERNLLENGDFGDGIAGWASLPWDIERENQPEGVVEVRDFVEGPAIRFHRVGEGHADVSVRQLVNQDITDFETLRLDLQMKIVWHSLGVCGSVGSECPLFVRVEYDDIYGNGQRWQQGFFATGVVNQVGTPDICETCPAPRLPHYQVPPSQFAFYQADLLEGLAQEGLLPPSRIKSVSLIASGHSFEVEVFDVALIAEE